MIQASLQANFSIVGDGTSLSFKFGINDSFVGVANGAGASGFPPKSLSNPDDVGAVTVVGSPALTATATLSKSFVTITFSSAPGAGTQYGLAVPLLYNSL